MTSDDRGLSQFLLRAAYDLRWVSAILLLLPRKPKPGLPTPFATDGETLFYSDHWHEFDIETCYLSLGHIYLHLLLGHYNLPAIVKQDAESFGPHALMLWDLCCDACVTVWLYDIFDSGAFNKLINNELHTLQELLKHYLLDKWASIDLGTLTSKPAVAIYNMLRHEAITLNYLYFQCDSWHRDIQWHESAKAHSSTSSDQIDSEQEELPQYDDSQDEQAQDELAQYDDSQDTLGQTKLGQMKLEQEKLMQESSSTAESTASKYSHLGKLVEALRFSEARAGLLNKASQLLNKRRSPDEQIPTAFDTHLFIDSALGHSFNTKQQYLNHLRAELIEKSQGFFPEFHLSQIEGLALVNLPTGSWVQKLHEYLSAYYQDYSWRKLNRRHLWQKLYLPSLVQESTLRIAIAMDTSGSMSKEELRDSCNAILGICRLFPHFDFLVMQCDAAVHRRLRVDSSMSDEEIAEAIRLVQGGGGTDFRPVFEHIEKLRGEFDPAALIFFTDLWGTFPSKAPDYPTLWLWTSTTSFCPSVPFGEIYPIRSF